jgi:hypothetical protein
MIKRFSEREEVVRNDVLSAFLDFLIAIDQEEHSGIEPTVKRRKGINGKHVDGHSDDDIGIMLQADVSAIVQSLAKQLHGKSIVTTQIGFSIMSKITTVLMGGLENSFDIILSLVKSVLTIEKNVFYNSNTNIKIQVLDFVNSLLKNHEPYLLWPILVSCILLVAFPDSSANQFEQSTVITPKVYESCWNLIRETELEAEVTEKAICTLGVLVSRAGKLVNNSEIIENVFPFITSQIHVESTKLSAIETIKLLVESEISSPVTALLPVVVEVRQLLTKSHRPTVAAAIPCLMTLLLESKGHIPSLLYNDILADIVSVLSLHSDVLILPLIFDLIAIIANDAHQLQDVVTFMTSQMIPTLITVISTHYFALGSATSLKSLLNLWDILLIHQKVYDTYHLAIVPLLDVDSYPKEVHLY